jgi:ribonuclease Z
MPDPSRSGPCVAVVAGKRLFVVDAGTGGVRNFNLIGLAANDIEAQFLTHFHSDHIDGLGELALQRWIGSDNAAPLPVYGPEGVEHVVTGFDLAYRDDQGYRTAHHGTTVANPVSAGMRARPFETPEYGKEVVVLDDGGVKVTAFKVPHDPAKPAVGYRFDYGGRAVVISGDTAKSPEIARMAQGADLLVHEALSRELVGAMNEAAQETGNASIAKITADILDYHASPVEAAETAQEAGVGHLLYYHIVPPLPVPGLDVVFLDGVSEAFDGGVTLGVDGSSVFLPAGSDAIEAN